jgi:hypothetical protein
MIAAIASRLPLPAHPAVIGYSRESGRFLGNNGLWACVGSYHHDATFRNPLGSSALDAVEVITYPLERLKSEDHCLQPQFVSIVKARSICSKSGAGFLVMIETDASTG